MRKNIREVAFYVLATLVLALMWYATVSVLSREIPAANVQPANILLGIVLSWGGMVVGYFFGSSKGSADKTEAMTAKPDAKPEG